MISLAFNLRFSLLYLSSVSISAAVITLILRHAEAVMKSTGSALLSTSVMSSLWVLSVIMTPYIGRICNRYSPGIIFVITSAASATIVFALMQTEISNIFYVLTAYSVLGLLRSISWNSCNLAIKLYLQDGMQKGAYSLIGSSRTVGSLLGAYLIFEASSLKQTLIMGASLYMFALIAGLLFLLSCWGIKNNTRKHNKKEPNFKVLRSILKYVWADPNLVRSFTFVILANGLFFGLHQSLRIVYPVMVLGGSGDAVGTIQFISKLSGLAASFYITFSNLEPCPVKWLRYSNKASTYSMYGAAVLVALLDFVLTAEMGIILYGAFYFLFRATNTHEIASLYNQVKLEKISDLGAFTNSVGLIVTVVVSLIVGQCIDSLGLRTTLIVFALVTIGITYWIECYSSRLRARNN